jgi:hypothetical protein
LPRLFFDSTGNSTTFGVVSLLNSSFTTDDSFELFELSVVALLLLCGVVVDDDCLQELEIQTKKVDNKIKQTIA